MTKKTVSRRNHIVNAKGKSLGRLASEIAIYLQGKNKADFMPNSDSGDTVEVKNLSEVKFTGNKINQKQYHHYSGYPGGLKTTTFEKHWEADRAETLRKIVRQMLPNNSFRKERLKRLQIDTEA